MDTTLISILATGAGTVITTVIATTALVLRGIGNLRSHMDQRVDGVHTELGERIDAQSARIDGVRTELGERIDAQSARIDGLRTGLERRFESVETKLARTSDDVAFIKGQLTAQLDD